MILSNPLALSQRPLLQTLVTQRCRDSPAQQRNLIATRTHNLRRRWRQRRNGGTVTRCRHVVLLLRYFYCEHKGFWNVIRQIFCWSAASEQKESARHQCQWPRTPAHDRLEPHLRPRRDFRGRWRNDGRSRWRHRAPATEYAPANICSHHRSVLLMRGFAQISADTGRRAVAPVLAVVQVERRHRKAANLSSATSTAASRHLYVLRGLHRTRNDRLSSLLCRMTLSATGGARARVQGGAVRRRCRGQVQSHLASLQKHLHPEPPLHARSRLPDEDAGSGRELGRASALGHGRTGAVRYCYFISSCIARSETVPTIVTGSCYFF